MIKPYDPEIKELIDQYKRHQQFEHMATTLGYIRYNVLPYYEASPYKMKGVSHIIRKLKYVDYIYQVSPITMQIIPEACLSLAAAYYELSLVWDEFNPRYDGYSVGQKSTKIICENFLRDIEENVPCGTMYWLYILQEADIIASPTYGRLKPGGAELLYDVNNMADLQMMSFKDFIDETISDYSLIYPTYEKANVYKIAIGRLWAKYGPNGAFRIHGATLNGCHEITSKYDTFQNKLDEIRKAVYE